MLTFKEVDTNSQTRRYYVDVLVTPDDAAAILAMSCGNRRTKAAHVEGLAEANKASDWQQDGNVLKFARGGIFFDGHHRILAIAKSGRPALLDIGVGFDSKAIETVDSGVPRRLQDQISMIGKQDNPFHRAAYLNTCAFLASGETVRITNLTAANRWRRPFEDGIEWAVETLANQKIRTFCNSPIAGALAFAYKANPDAVSSFTAGLISGANLEPGSPVLALRNAVINGAASGHIGRVSKGAASRKTLNALAAFVSGSKMDKVFDGNRGLEKFRKPYLDDAELQEMIVPWKRVMTDSVRSSAKARCEAANG